MKESLSLRDIVVGGAAFYVAYSAIRAYDGDIVSYHHDVTGLLFLFAGLLLLPAFCRGTFLNLGVVKNFLPLCLLGGVAVWSCFISSQSAAAFNKLQLYFAVLLYAWVLRAWLEKPTRFTVAAVLIGLSVVHLSSLALAIEELFRLDGSLINPSKAPYHGHVRHLSIHGMLAAAAGVSLILIDSRLRLVGALISVLALFGIVFMGARGALAGWLVFVVVSTFLLKSSRAQVLLYAGGSLLAAIGLTLLLQANGLSHPFSGSLLSRAASSGGSIAGGSGRIEIWLLTLEAIFRQPLLGYGLDASRTILAADYRLLLPTQTIYQPHNTVLQFALELGLAGVLCLAWLVFDLYKRALFAVACPSSVPMRTVTALSLSMCSGVFAYAVVDGLFYHAVPLVFVGTLLALTYAAIDSGSASADHAA